MRNLSGQAPSFEFRDGRFLLDRDRRLPLWRQIAEVVEREIRRESFDPGDRLPSEGELASWFGVNRHTVRRALLELKQRKVVNVEQGRGTFVHEGVVDYPVSRRTRFSENLTRQNRAPLGMLLSGVVLEPDQEVSEALQMHRSRQVICLEILREGDGRPLSLSTHYFPMPRFAGIAETFRRTGSVTACLAFHGVPDFFRDETRVVARAPTREEARLLLLSRNRPILETRSINVDDHGVPVDFGVACYAGDRVQLVVKTS
ncbi:MAG: phosphonate metabolism transcriptional regulator PhnF [Proteobacteria bacterium]|nr:phosphonate metabolism transcriptional regulator PhnF [Pseudomonadota bacterium]